MIPPGTAVTIAHSSVHVHVAYAGSEQTILPYVSAAHLQLHNRHGLRQQASNVCIMIRSDQADARCLTPLSAHLLALL